MLLCGIILLVAGFGVFSIVKSKEADRASFMVKMGELTVKVNQLELSKIELDKVKQEKAEMEAKFQSDIAALESQISESRRTESQLKTKLETLSKEKEAMAKYSENSGLIVAKLQKKIEALEKEKAAAIEAAKESADAPVYKYVDPMDDGAASPASTQETKPQVGSKLAGEEVVDLGRIIIRQETNEAARVEHVNSLYGFIVLSAGSDDGLRKDSIVNITRNNRLVAKAVVKKVRESTASAVTLPEWTREEIRVGDVISSTQMDTPVPAPFFKRT